jgi:ABC-type dipeptide/oligopeptide/nickel transport system permease component
MLLRIAIGVVIAALLELINGMFTFMLPPLIIITPVCMTIGILAAIRHGRKGSHRAAV